MNAEDLPSDSEQSDVDYVPSDIEKNLSEEESDEAVSDNDEKNISTDKSTKRRKKQRKGRKLKKSEEIGIDDEDCENEVNKISKPLSAEEEKKKADSLWADFMKDCGGASKPQELSTKGSSSSSDSVIQRVVEKTQENPNIISEKTVKVTEIFQFAGEEVRIEKEIQKDTPSTNETASVTKPLALKSGRGSGLASVLGQLGKKNKLSTLEKSKLDWSKFKKEEGIEEELQIHNKGKEGYLEKQDFLQRADLRQFEIEKQMRTSRRNYH